MSLVERVARAIAIADGYDLDTLDASDFMKHARAAIEAMREPTEAMVEEIRLAMSAEKFVSHMRAMDCWDAGICAALGQKWNAAGDKRAALTPEKTNVTG